MSQTLYWAAAVLLMAVVTYIPRMLPLSLIRKRIGNQFLQSFLYYMPYAVLGAMTFPSILYATATPWSATAGFAAALILSFVGWNLLPVALVSTGVVFLTEWLMGMW